MSVNNDSCFIKFLKDEINLSNDSIAIAQRYVTTSGNSIQQNVSVFSMVLWQYGLVTLEQLDKIYDWLETP